MIHWLATAALSQQVVELPTGEFLGSVRARSVGGAMAPIAESATSQLYNPAAAAVRRPYMAQNTVSPDLTLQALDHPVITDGLQALFGPYPEPPLPRRRALWQVGTNLKIARDSVALHVKGHSWNLPHGDPLATTLAGAGWAHSEDTWVVGVMPLLYGFHHYGKSGWGGALSVGGLWAPTGVPLRLGASARTPARAVLSGVIDSIDGRIPWGARLPWRAAAGASWTLGAKNIAGRYAPDKVHVGASGGPTVLLTSEVVWTGGSADAVGLLPLVTGGPIQPTGSALEVHGGAEADLARRTLRLRAGGYTQPGRFDGIPALGHVTGGVALQVFRFPSDLPWRLTGSIDATKEEVSWGFGLETW